MRRIIWGAIAVVVLLGGIYAIAVYASFTNACASRGGKTSAGTCTYVKSP